jgi:hypothetical protein
MQCILHVCIKRQQTKQTLMCLSFIGIKYKMIPIRNITARECAEHFYVALGGPLWFSLSTDIVDVSDRGRQVTSDAWASMSQTQHRGCSNSSFTCLPPRVERTFGALASLPEELSQGTPWRSTLDGAAALGPVGFTYDTQGWCRILAKIKKVSRDALPPTQRRDRETGDMAGGHHDGEQEVPYTR